MIKANFLTATDSSGQTGRYPVSIETLNLLQEQSAFIAKTFGAMFGRNNLILKVPTENEDGLCLYEGELVPIDHKASTYPSGGGEDYEIAFQFEEIPNFKEEIEVAGETFRQARKMSKAFIYSLDAYSDSLEFENSDEAKRVGAFFDGEEGYTICRLNDVANDTRGLYKDDFLDVTEFINNLPRIYTNAMEGSPSLKRDVEQIKTDQERLADDFNEFEPRIEGDIENVEKKLNQKAQERQALEDKRFGLIYALIKHLYINLKRQIGADYDQFIDYYYKGSFGFIPEQETEKFLKELQNSADHLRD